MSIVNLLQIFRLKRRRFPKCMSILHSAPKLWQSSFTHTFCQQFLSFSVFQFSFHFFISHWIFFTVVRLLAAGTLKISISNSPNSLKVNTASLISEAMPQPHFSN